MRAAAGEGREHVCEWRSAKNLRPDVIGPTPPFAQLSSPTAHTAFAPLSNFDMHMLTAALVRRVGLVAGVMGLLLHLFLSVP